MVQPDNRAGFILGGGAENFDFERGSSSVKYMVYD